MFWSLGHHLYFHTFKSSEQFELGYKEVLGSLKESWQKLSSLQIFSIYYDFLIFRLLFLLILDISPHMHSKCLLFIVAVYYSCTRRCIVWWVERTKVSLQQPMINNKKRKDNKQKYSCSLKSYNSFHSQRFPGPAGYESGKSVHQLSM